MPRKGNKWEDHPYVLRRLSSQSLDNGDFTQQFFVGSGKGGQNRNRRST
jgi:hypothetical protein